jgi:hypothetical protein
MPSTKAHSVLRPHGTIIISDPDLPHDVHMDVMTCVHCQSAWVVRPGSGRVRGFCMRCNGVTCGGPKCLECLGPIERRIELYEAGKLAVL